MQTRLAEIFQEQHEAKLWLLRRLRHHDVPHRPVLVDELLNIVAAHYAVLENVVLPALQSSAAEISTVLDSQRAIVAGMSELLAVRNEGREVQLPALDALQAQFAHQRSLEERHLLPAIKSHLSVGQEAICCAEAEATIERRVGAAR